MLVDRIRASWTSGLFGKGAVMERSRPGLIAFAVLFFGGVSTVIHFSKDVRSVDVVGLSAGGAACGAALFRFITALVASSKARRTTG
jgi:hypothetical protein